MGREPINQEIQGPNLINTFISAKDNKTLSGNFYRLVDENIPNFVSNESERNLYYEKVRKNQDNTLFLTKDYVGKITYKSDTPTELTNSHNLMESSRNAYQGENLIGVYFTNGTRPAKKGDNKPFNINELIASGNGSEKIILLWDFIPTKPVENNNPSESEQREGDQRYESNPYENDYNQETRRPETIEQVIEATDNETLSRKFYHFVEENIPNFVSNESERNLYYEKVKNNQDNTLFLTKEYAGKITYKSKEGITPTETTNSHNLMESLQYDGIELIGVYFTNGTRPAAKEDNKLFNINELTTLGNGSEKIVILWGANSTKPVENN
ncbi:hypothetical protein, partial [Candidatus Phytoplasma pruni]